MNHYTYLLQSKTDDMMYIGVRSCMCLPEDDNYWGSSKHLPKGKNKNLNDLCDKFILGRFESREDALTDEIRRHRINDVAVSKLFWNRAKQTSTGYDTTGMPSPMRGKHLSDKAKALISLANSGKPSPMKGKVHTSESRLKISEALKGKEAWSKGKKFTDEHKKNLSDAHKGLRYQIEFGFKKGQTAWNKGTPCTDAQKAVISERNTGYTHTDSAKAKIRQAHLGKKQKSITCPHCQKTGGNNMRRYHFDNCKEAICQ